MVSGWGILKKLNAPKLSLSECDEMKNFRKRLVIYAKDIAMITGRSRRAAQEIMKKIRIFYGKEKNALVTVREFCEFTNMNEQLVQEFLM